MFCVLRNRNKKSESPVKLREKISNFIVKWLKNCKICRELTQFRGKTSCISWRHNSISQVSSRQRRGSWRYHDVKIMAKWPEGIGVMWSVFDRALIGKNSKRTSLQRTNCYWHEYTSIYIDKDGGVQCASKTTRIMSEKDFRTPALNRSRRHGNTLLTSSWIANHGHLNGIPSSLPQSGDRFYLSIC